MKFINPSGSPQQTRMSKDFGDGKIGLFDSGFGSLAGSARCLVLET